MTENALLFGPDKSLVGIVTEPARGAPGPRRGVIILNAGVLHRVGPNRAHVQLARALAAAGFVALRFDFSGIGDSAQPGGNEPFLQRAIREAIQAMDVLQQSHGVSEFVVAGICAGADYGLYVSSSDRRVVGAVLIDGYNMRNYWAAFYFYRRNLISPRSWFRFLIGRSLTWEVVRAAWTYRHSNRTGTLDTASILPTPEQYVAQVRALADRGTELLLFYTGMSPSYYNYRRLLRRKLGSWGSGTRISVTYMPESDHVFTLRGNRDRLVTSVTGWAQKLAAGPAPLPD